MTIDLRRKAIREGLAVRLFDIAMQDEQVYDSAIRRQAWEEERGSFEATAGLLLAFLSDNGVVLKTDQIEMVRLVSGTYDELANPFYDTAPLVESESHERASVGRRG